MVLVLLLLPDGAVAQETVEYYGLDALGSVRVVFDSNGSVTGRMDYGPFGEQLTVSTVGWKSYAQLFRDGETGLDYAEERQYQLRTARFGAPDSLRGKPMSPQSWNRYAYSLNAPIMYIDPSGLLAEAPTRNENRFGRLCSAEFSFSMCGGDDSFWSDSGFFEFGNEFAWAQQQGYSRGMPWDLWVGLQEHNQRVEAAFGQKSTNAPVPVVSTQTEVALPDGTTVTPNDDSDNPLRQLAQDIVDRTEPLTRPQVYAEFVALSAVGGRVITGWRYLPNVRGWEKAWGNNFRTGWHRLPNGDKWWNGRNLPHYHRRPGIGKHRPYEGW
jgi:RHS repeat-associated protein